MGGPFCKKVCANCRIDIGPSRIENDLEIRPAVAKRGVDAVSYNAACELQADNGGDADADAGITAGADTNDEFLDSFHLF